MGVQRCIQGLDQSVSQDDRHDDALLYLRRHAQAEDQPVGLQTGAVPHIRWSRDDRILGDLAPRSPQESITGRKCLDG